ncbi:MAG: UDP-N-acetylglucosamine 1-carboxyvinyltransferase [Caldiserica bacterium]|nr:UDP-N-acetylglucosamine 1-carboxyvinyltransferase [Caldisericota bacterium]
MASVIVVRGGRPLSGRVEISGAKNAVLPAIVASLLTDEPLVLKRAPGLLDVETQLALVEALGKRVERRGDVIAIHGETRRATAPQEIVSRMRASFLCLGPLIARLGEAHVPLPGGCVIGARPVDLHLAGLARLGVDIRVDGGVVHAAGTPRGGEVWLRYPSVGATEQLLLVGATIPEGVEIVNPAREPEVMDLVRLLAAMGAEVEILEDRFIVRGERLGGAEHAVIPDRIEAGTYLLAGPITGGEVELVEVHPEHLTALLVKLEECGVEVEAEGDRVRASSPGGWRGIEVETAPYPGFPTDLQPQLTAFLSLARGRSVIWERVFESRFGHVGELIRMGARITLQGQAITVEGVGELRGTGVAATDIRAGAALVLAGVAARGETRIRGVEHLRRGYENMEEKLSRLGAKIWVEEASVI